MPVNPSPDESVVSVADCECGRSDCHRLRLIIRDEGKEPVVRYVPLDQVQKISVHMEGWLYKRDQDPPVSILVHGAGKHSLPYMRRMGGHMDGMYTVCRETGKFGDLVKRLVPEDKLKATVAEFHAAHVKEFGPPPHGQ